MLRYVVLLLSFVSLLFANIPYTYPDGTTEKKSYDANDRLIDLDGQAYTYDANGNMVSDGTNSYGYDDKNRLVKVTTPNGIIEYEYDAEDHRIAKIVEGTTTTYLIDTNTPYAQVITESKENGTEVHYTYGNDLLSDGRQYFLTDALGSTRGLADSAETLTDTYDYKPYGELSHHEGTSETSFLFTGEQFDAETDNYYLRARYYDPATSRFLSRDTYDGKLIDPLSQNHYLYAGGSPSMFVDPSGHFSMASLTNSMSIMSTLGRIKSGLFSLGGRKGVSKLKLWTVYSVWAFRYAKRRTVKGGPHAYMYLKGRGSMPSYRYDVDMGGDPDIFESIWDTIGVAALGTIKRKTVGIGDKIRGKKIKIVKFTGFQMLLWQAVVLYGGDGGCAIEYSVNPAKGTSCFSWTAWATAKAILISRLPI